MNPSKITVKSNVAAWEEVMDFLCLWGGVTPKQPCIPCNNKNISWD